MLRAVCRVDAGEEAGLGHLQRCLSLAEALGRRAAQVFFLAPELDEVRARIEARGFHLLSSSIDWMEPCSRRAAQSIVDAARAQRCDAVITDSYEIRDSHVRALRDAGLRVIAIDDLAVEPSSAHVVVNGAAGAAALPYRSFTGDTEFLLGPQFALLPAAFADVPPRTIGDVDRVLVLVGGSDPNGALARVVQAIDRVPGMFEIVVVLGPFAPSDAGATPNGCRHNVRFVRAPRELLPLMRDADLAVSAGGHGLYELAALGTPTVAIRIADSQSHNVTQLAAHGVVRDGGRLGDAALGRRLAAAVTELLDKSLRAEMSRAGRQLIDGRGAARVAEAVLVSTGRRPS